VPQTGLEVSVTQVLAEGPCSDARIVTDTVEQLLADVSARARFQKQPCITLQGLGGHGGQLIELLQRVHRDRVSHVL
jgi:hypothetical protein